MSVLLTGASGFLGSHCLRHLLVNTDWRIVCPYTFRHRGLPERITTQLDGDPDWRYRVKFVQCDLSTPVNRTTAKVFGDIDCIINYASDSHVDRSIEDPVPFVQNNINTILYLLEYARTKDLTAFIQVSTDEVYGPALKGHTHPEWSSIIPSNPYSASKACQEALATSYWRTYGVPVVITNTMNLIGEMQDQEKFVPMIISRTLNRELIQVHASPTGEIGSRFYLHARNLADAILFLLRRGQISQYPSASRPDKWNIVGEREVDNLEMVIRVSDIIGLEPRTELTSFHASRPGHDLRYALDGTKLIEAGWQRPIPFEESLKALVEWTLNHPIWV